MTSGMLVSATVIYFGTAALLGLSGAVFGLLALRESGDTRRMVLVGAVPALAMAVAYVFMGMEWVTVTTGGREQSVARFAGYSVVLGAIGVIVREVLGLGRRQFLTMTVVLLLTPWFALASWLPDGGVLESVLTLCTILAYLGGVYYLFGPVTRRARAVSGQRRLLYAKLRNLFVLCWGALILQSALSEQALGLTNLFVGQLGASYTDIIFMIGIAALVVSGKAVYEDRETASDESTAGSPTVTPSASRES
ncbi:bacteriorhodopsin [Halovenus sp. HT40]|uniref:bacteriorhodopsin n=1 Tax=Halovenus sp. HT40 TaxID=3126691 RepID=UPI00300EBC2C